MCVCVYDIFFIHSYVDGHLGCFHTLAIIHNAAMNIGVHVSFQISVFGFFGYVLRSGIAGSYGMNSFFFSFEMRDLSSPTRDGTCTPAVEAWSLNHWTAREVPTLFIFKALAE